MSTDGDWMHALADRFRTTCAAFPDDELVIVFDIDGTIVDTRNLVVHTLLSYDRAHGSERFVGITVDDVAHHESRIDDILDAFGLDDACRREVRDWFVRHAWDPTSLAAAHLPYRGVMEVIRWFQLQPRTHVAINTGRPEALREVTVTSLNALGRRHRVTFPDELVFMNVGTLEDVPTAKVEALRRLRERGFRIVAVVDNEPAMIAAMAEADDAGDVLFLHADTMFESRLRPTPRTVSGSTYGLSRLVDEAELGRRVTFVWHGVNDLHNLEQFLGSNVRWAELDVRRDPAGRLVLRHDGFAETPWARDEGLLRLAPCLEALRAAGRSAKLDLKEGGDTLDDVLLLVTTLGFTDDELWFNGGVEALGQDGFRRIRARHPGAIVQSPIDFLIPLQIAAPTFADAALSMLRAWGIDRVSLDWRTAGVRTAVELAEAGGWDVNIYGLPDLDAFLEAALLLPTSVTADFNFPEWDHHGRGPARGPLATPIRLR